MIITEAIFADKHWMRIIIDSLHAKLRLGDLFVVMFLDYCSVNSKRQRAEKIIREYKLDKPYSSPIQISCHGAALDKFLNNFSLIIDSLNFTEDAIFLDIFKKTAKNINRMFHLWNSKKFYTLEEMKKCLSRFDQYVLFWKKMKEYLKKVCFVSFFLHFFQYFPYFVFCTENWI